MAITAIFLAFTLFLPHPTLCAAAGSSGFSRGSSLVRAEPLAVGVLADGQAVEQRRAADQGQAVEQGIDLQPPPAADPTQLAAQAAGSASPTMADASMSAIQLHSADDPDEEEEETSYTEYFNLAKTWAASSAKMTSFTTTVAKKWFSSSVDLSTSGRFYTLATTLPKYLSYDVISIWKVKSGTLTNLELVRCNQNLAAGAGVNGYSDVPRLAFSLPQPLAEHEWLRLGKSTTKLNIFLCPSFFSKNVTSQAAILIHEVLHKLGCNDLAYKSSDSLLLSPSRSIANTNSWVSYILDVAFTTDMTLDAWGEMPSVNCTRLPGSLCSRDVDKGLCIMRANTAGRTCDQYCRANSLLCDNSWNTGSSSTVGTCGAGSRTFCSVAASTQLCACTEEDLVGTMNVFPTGKR